MNSLKRERYKCDLRALSILYFKHFVSPRISASDEYQILYPQAIIIPSRIFADSFYLMFVFTFQFHDVHVNAVSNRLSKCKYKIQNLDYFFPIFMWSL